MIKICSKLHRQHKQHHYISVTNTKRRRSWNWKGAECRLKYADINAEGRKLNHVDSEVQQYGTHKSLAPVGVVMLWEAKLKATLSAASRDLDVTFCPSNHGGIRIIKPDCISTGILMKSACMRVHV